MSKFNLTDGRKRERKKRGSFLLVCSVSVKQNCRRQTSVMSTIRRNCTNTAETEESVSAKSAEAFY